MRALRLVEGGGQPVQARFVHWGMRTNTEPLSTVCAACGVKFLVITICGPTDLAGVAVVLAGKWWGTLEVPIECGNKVLCGLC